MAAYDTPPKPNPIGIVAGGGVLPDELAKALSKNQKLGKFSNISKHTIAASWSY